MIIRKTQTTYKRYKRNEDFNPYIERVKVTTLWFLFIPIYTYEELLTNKGK
jgi:hypothetical protein